MSGTGAVGPETGGPSATHRLIGDRIPFDAEAYAARTASVDCFVCAFLDGDPRFAHETVLDDGEHVVFLNRFPTTPAQLLVVPRRHVEHLARELDESAWLRLQAVVHRAARALEAVVPSERTYVLSLGSQQANRHLHVHVAALPPGTPPSQQQDAALAAERGVLAPTAAETGRLAAALRRALAEEQRAVRDSAEQPARAHGR